MKQLTFRCVTEENSELFHALMQAYAKELDGHQNDSTDPEILKKWTDRIIRTSNENHMILKFCCADEEIIGFFLGKIDRSEDKGYKKVGYGYIMEFYVKPEHRRKSYGRIMFNRMEQFFREQGASRMYLTADPVTGKPFWEALGFISTGELSPKNNLEIFIKSVSPEIITSSASELLTDCHAEKAEIKDAINIALLYEKNVDKLHGNEISYNEWCKMLCANDPDEANFLIYSGAMPVAWLKINGLSDSDTCWISMLAVEPEFQRQGAGSFAVGFAEKYCKSEGKKQLFVKTTEDNIPAQKLYKKCGYTVCEHNEYATGDGIKRMGCTFAKQLYAHPKT